MQLKYRLYQRDGGVDYAPDGREVLIKECLSKTMSSVGQQCVNQATVACRHKLIDAIERRKVRFYSVRVTPSARKSAAASASGRSAATS